jgi:hypothetical protein
VVGGDNSVRDARDDAQLVRAHVGGDRTAFAELVKARAPIGCSHSGF